MLKNQGTEEGLQKGWWKQMIKVCRNCADRCAEPNCHMTCERYIKAKEEFEAEKKQIRESMKPYQEYSEVKQRNIERTMRRVNR